MEKKLMKKFISFSFGGYISAAIGFFSIPIITRLISPEQYGIFSIINLVTNLSLLTIILGLDQGFVRFFYEEREGNRGGLLYNSLKIPMIIFCGYIVMVFLLRRKVGEYLFGEDNIKLIILLLIYTFFTLINRFSFLIIRMKQKGILLSCCQIMQSILGCVLILPFFKIYGDSYKSILTPTVLTLVIITLLSIFVERKFWNFKGVESTIPQKELLKFSLPLFLTMALTWIFQGFDKIAIKMYSDMAQLGLYAGAFKIVGLLSIIQSGFTTFWIPVAYEKYSNNPNEKIFFEKVNDYISLVMFGVAAILLISKDLIVILLGDKFKEAAQIMPTLIMMPIMYTISETTVLGINFSKDSKKHLYISVVSALFNVIGNMILVPKIGAKGAAISTGFAYILFFSLRTYFSMQLINFKFKLKKIYSITALLMGYAIYLSFYNICILTYSFGIIILIIIILSYVECIKEGIEILKKVKN